VHNVHVLVPESTLMTTKARGLRLPEDLERQIEREGKERGQSWTRAALDLLSEGVRMRRAPGILFGDGPTGRRAVVAGTGLDVWEVIRTWQDGGKSVDETRANYPWLSEAQIRAAIGYYELYPVEVDERLTREREWTAERVRMELPFAKPRR
jgi:uncharacterized protein (DUF433 family)